MEDLKRTFNMHTYVVERIIGTLLPPKYMSQLFYQTDYSTYYLLSFLSVDEFPQFIYIFFFTALRHTLTLELLPGKSVNWGTIFAFISTHFM